MKCLKNENNFVATEILMVWLWELSVRFAISETGVLYSTFRTVQSLILLSTLGTQTFVAPVIHWTVSMIRFIELDFSLNYLMYDVHVHHQSAQMI